MYKILLLFFFNIYILHSVLAQLIPWDDTQNKHWPKGFQKVEILSLKDQSKQPSIFYKATKPGRPLIVSLHTWSGDYKQADSISWKIPIYDYNYIHPNFRGTNNHPMACGSEYAIADIVDAINYAIDSLQANPDEVHIIGTSGGGYMAMMCYMQLNKKVKSISSWVGISDLEAWYYESLGRGQKYASDIVACTGSGEQLNATAAQNRSPLHMTPVRTDRALHLYAGIHDGYQGSVPISHTLLFYNKAVKANEGGKADTVSMQNINKLLSSRTGDWDTTNYGMIGNRNLHYFKTKGNISVSVFEGKHEQLVSVALPLIGIQPHQRKNYKLLTIGDSNGASAHGWVNQLGAELPFTKITNFSKAGRTIGFNNNNDSSLNELNLIDEHLQNLQNQWGNNLDAIVICLGTNDAKSIFSNRQQEVVTNFLQLRKKLLNTVNGFPKKPLVIWVTPPPIGVVADSSEKYFSANERVSNIAAFMQKHAIGEKEIVIDAFHFFEKNINNLAKDGIHMEAKGQQQLAILISDQIRAGLTP